MKLHLVQAEKRKIRYRIQKHGPEKATGYVICRINNGTMPTALGVYTVERLLNGGEYVSAGQVLKTMKAQNQEHALVDKLYSSWLWCVGRKRAALTFAIYAAEKWNRSYLYNQVAALLSLSGNPRKELRYRKQAAQLAIQEQLQSTRVSA